MFRLKAAHGPNRRRRNTVGPPIHKTKESFSGLCLPTTSAHTPKSPSHWCVLCNQSRIHNTPACAHLHAMLHHAMPFPQHAWGTEQGLRQVCSPLFNPHRAHAIPHRVPSPTNSLCVGTHGHVSQGAPVNTNKAATACAVNMQCDAMPCHAMPDHAVPC